MSSASAALASDDPTGTVQKRQDWVRDFNRRWRQVRGRIRSELRNNARLHPDSERSTGRQVREFRDFLERVIDEEVVEPMPIGGVINGNHHTGPPVREGFITGVLLGTAHLRRADFDVESLSYNDAERLLLSPQYRDALEDRYEFAYDDLVDIGEETHTQAYRNYRDQLGETGAIATLLTGATQTADGIQDRINKRGQTGTSRLANSHTVQAVNDGAMQTYRDADVEEVGVIAETDGGTGEVDPDNVDWMTAQDHRVCFECQALAINSPYPIEDAPRPVEDSHPGCRCFIVPATN